MTPTEALIKFLKAAELLRDTIDPKLLEFAKELPIWALAKKGLLMEAQAIAAIRDRLRIDHLDLEDPEVVGKLKTSEFANKVGGKLLWKARMVPLFDVGPDVVTAVANPFDQEAVAAIGFALSKPVKVVIAEEAKILVLLGRYYPQQQVGVSADSDGADTLEISSETPDPNNTEDTAPIVKLANKIIADAIKVNASDVHLEPNENNLAVRFRVDGVLQDVITIPKQIRRNVIMRFKILAGMDISEKRRPQDGRIRVNFGNKSTDLRVSSIPVASGEKLVLRLMHADYGSLLFKDLGMPAELQAKLERTLRRQGKMVLVSGPTGSGKTTTLYVALNFLSDGTTNITTIEDPIEYKFQHLNQIQVNNAANVNFASVLRAVLRQDPDIIMIGEIRDGETLKVAMQAAQTGHLVLSTVHTNDAPSVVTRLVDLGGDPFNISTSLAGVLAQRLARKVCVKCKTAIVPSAVEEHRQYLDKYKIDPATLVTGRGCADCFYSGYRGQLGIFSYLEVNDEISELIYKRASTETLITAAKKNGYLALDEAAVQMLREGVTSFSEVLPHLNLDQPVVEAPPEPPAEPAPVVAIPQPIAIPEVHIRVDHSGSTSTSAPSAASDRLSQARVLIVDDNKNVRKMLGTLLRKEMVIVDEAQNGLEALQKVYAQLPTLIICDLKMPEMDGKEFLQRIHRNKKMRDIPVIMLTVDDSEESEIDLIGLGACEFLSKKSSPSVLVSRIRKVLESLS